MSSVLYVAAKVLVLHPRKPAILLGRREISGRVGYEAPGGRVQINFEAKRAESLEACALREAHEEIGLSVRLVEPLGGYAFFWETQARTCTYNFVFLAELEAGVDPTGLRPCADGKPCSFWPEWVLSKDIRALPIRENHAGLWPLLQKAVSSARQR